MVLGRSGAPLAGPELARRLRGERVTFLATPPALLDALEPAELPALGTLVLGGDRSSAETAGRWAPGRRLWNAYAPTEATVFATAWPAPAPFPEPPIAPPIGRPIAGMRAVLLTPELTPVPPGEEGEIALGGVGVARGYLGQPERTAERFVPDPKAGRDEIPPGDRLYRTGDLGRQLPDGDLAFAGRVDLQVKIRGVRIEPGEIEAALRTHPEVAEAAVVAREDRPGDRRLAAYVVPRPGAHPVAARLREHLAARLPEALIPGAFVLLDALPQTVHGKLDRNALPAPVLQSGISEEGSRAPQGPVEAALAALFRQLLGLHWVGVRDSFFALGGHSLLAAQLAARARQELGIELPLGYLFAHPTVEELARVQDLQGEPEATPLPPLVPGPRPALLPLSFPQERVWFLARLAPGSVAYNFQAEIRLQGALDAPALERALCEVVRRHEILRTRFPEVDGGPVQVIEPAWEVRLPVEDLSFLPRPEREQAVQTRIEGEIRRPFDLDRLPLIRWHLFRLGPEEHLLLQIEHHLVHDGWSLAVLTGEIAALYAAFAAGRPSPLPAPSLQYADFALWQRGYLQGEALERQLAWWRERLAGCPPLLALPTDRPRPAVQTFRGGAVRCTVPPALYRSLRERSREAGATLFMTMFAGFAALLSRLSGQADLAVGSGVANRRLREVEGMLGMVVNTLVLRADLAGDPGFAALLGRVRESVLGAQAYQDLPFEKLVETLRPERRLATNPLFQALFSFHDSPMPELSFGGLTGRLAARPNGSAKADLNVVAVPAAEQRVGRGTSTSDDDLYVLWEYSADLFDRATATRSVEQYLTLLAGAMADPERRLSELPLLAAAERHQVTQEWNDTAAPFPRDGAVHGLFAAVAAAAPDRTALVFGERHLSSGTLERRAQRLARHLAALGVGPEVPVVLYLERSVEMVVAALAVLQAGGFYVPLDPAHPAERQRLLLADIAGVAESSAGESPLLLTSAGLAPALVSEVAGAGARVLCLDGAPAGVPAAVAHRSAAPLPAAASGGGEALCYVVYTSGSTGTPKGVAVSHAAVLRLAIRAGFVDLGPGCRVGYASNIAFDAATFELWGTLLAGATVAGLTRDEALTPGGLAAALRAGRVDVLFLTTALVHQVAREEPATFAPLATLLFGGEAADPARIAALLAAGGPKRLCHVYGPTESTTFATSHPLPAVAPGAASLPIGRPIGNTTAHVLGRDFRPQPVGVPGELCLGGDGLARGYLGRPEQTAERFVPDPLALRPGCRLYRTGDRVRTLQGGALDFLGRLDGQVKVRGFRIELGEVEAALRRHPGVVDAAAVLRDEDGGERRLVGYVVARQEGDLQLLAGLRAFLKPLLPEPAIPTAFVRLPYLPVNANGKVDRTALPDPARERLAPVESYVAPRTPIEEGVAAIWAELLGLDRVGAEDDFFALGGHSLLATRVLSRLRRDHQVEVPMRTLFEASTVAALAAEVERLQQEAALPDDLEWSAALDGGAPATDLDRLSDAEVDALLLAAMQEGEEG
ncbi:MAG TPA: amino acid adenylation domain-containing protein [Thermoanaerobaculia bacterium]|nr:amino acid adenylation domain-containing protein [Thermoanaerobaculia bacterium]